MPPTVRAFSSPRPVLQNVLLFAAPRVDDTPVGLTRFHARPIDSDMFLGRAGRIENSVRSIDSGTRYFGNDVLRVDPPFLQSGLC